MCYSAQIWADYKKYERFGGHVSIKEYLVLAGWSRSKGNWTKVVPKAMRQSMLRARDESLATCAFFAEVESRTTIQDEIDTQLVRHIEASEKVGAPKPTKKALNDLRVSSNKIEAGQRKLRDMDSPASADGIDRIWPGHFAPVLIRDAETDELLIVPMRYRCRLPGWTEADEFAKPGTYNARRDKLSTVWRKVFGVHHGVMAVHRFYESVLLHDLQQRDLVPGEQEQKTEIVFTPKTGEDLLVACLWTYTEARGKDPGFYSFAVITDHPPPEVAIAGHDRCIVSLQEDDLEAWLSPTSKTAAELQGILDRGELERPYFEHELAREEPETVD